SQQLARVEVDALGSGRRLAIEVALDLRHAVPRVARRVAVDGIVVEHAEDVRHWVWVLSARGLPSARPRGRLGEGGRVNGLSGSDVWRAGERASSRGEPRWRT